MLEGTDTGDPPLSAETIVHIYVPMNHPPVVDEEISFAVPEKIPVGAMIGEIAVYDIDIGSDENQYLIYNIENEKGRYLNKKGCIYFCGPNNLLLLTKRFELGFCIPSLSQSGQ